MTTTPAAGDTTARDRRYLVAAAVLVIAVVVATVLFGLQRPPALERISATPEPAPPGGVAFTAWRSGEQCLHVVWPDGERTRPRCAPDSADVVAWPEPDRLVLRSYGGSPVLLDVDPRTGDVRRSRSTDDLHPRAWTPHEEPTTYRDGDELVVEHDGRELWRVEAPATYDLSRLATSPDGRWVAATDAADRLLLLDVDATVPPRIWAEDVAGWSQLRWQGTPVDTR